MSSVAGMMRGLERALARAALSDDRELAGRVRDGGRRSIFTLNGLIRMGRLYEEENAAFEQPIKEFMDALGAMLELLGTVHIVCVEDQIYVNDVRLRLGGAEQAVSESFIGELARHGVGGLSFHGPLDRNDTKRLALALSKPSSDRASPRRALAAQLATIHQVELAGTFKFKIGGEASAKVKEVEEALHRSEAVVKEAILNLATARIPNPLPIRRAVMDLVEALRADPATGLAESGRTHTGGIGEPHLVAVANLSVLLGQSLGLSDAALSDLGVAAMMHDIGSSQSTDWTGHAAAGGRILARQRGFHEAKIRRILLTLEHHLPFQAPDAPNQPNLPARPSLFARILHIVDDYDVLTARYTDCLPPMSPSRAVGSMWAARGVAYDPDLLALFVRLIGRYPPGALMELTDGRWAVSVSGGRDRDKFEWPLVRIVREADGTPRDATETVDLFDHRAKIQPRLLLDTILESDQSTASMIEGALRNPLPPDLHHL